MTWGYFFSSPWSQSREYNSLLSYQSSSRARVRAGVSGVLCSFNSSGLKPAGTFLELGGYDESL